MPKCTVFENPQGSKQIVYDVVPGGIVYEVSEERIRDLEKAEFSRIKELINYVCITSQRVYAQ